MTETIIVTLLGACGFGIVTAGGWLVMQLDEVKKENKELRTRIDTLESSLIIAQEENRRQKEAMLRMDERLRQAQEIQNKLEEIIATLNDRKTSRRTRTQA